MLYSSLARLKRDMGFIDGEDSYDDLLVSYLQIASEMIDRTTGRRFDMYYAAYKFDYPLVGKNQMGVYDPRQFVYLMNAMGGFRDNSLSLPFDLVELTRVVNGDGNEIAVSDCILEPANIYPKNRITLIDSLRWLKGTRSGKQCITVSGLWGYTKDPATAWIPSGDALAAETASDDIEILVSAPSSRDGEGFAPRFSAGQLLKLMDGENIEFMSVIAVNPLDLTLTVHRGVNGTNMHAWSLDTPIWIYKPHSNVEKACKRLALYLFRMKDVDSFDRQPNPGGGTLPTTIPKDVLQLLPAKRVKPF